MNWGYGGSGNDKLVTLPQAYTTSYAVVITGSQSAKNYSFNVGWNTITVSSFKYRTEQPVRYITIGY